MGNVKLQLIRLVMGIGICLAIALFLYLEWMFMVVILDSKSTYLKLVVIGPMVLYLCWIAGKLAYKPKDKGKGKR